jgi:hypothetical protein
MSTAPVLQLGNAELRRVEEMRLPSQLAHVTQDLEFIDANRSWLSPAYINDATGWDIVFQSWILNHQGRTIVIDPCTGNNRPHCQPWFDNLVLHSHASRSLRLEHPAARRQMGADFPQCPLSVRPARI